MPYPEEIPPLGDLVEPPVELDRLAHAVIGAAIEVHRQLGPGVSEDCYEGAMALELTTRRIPFERQKRIDIMYKGVRVGHMRLDLLVGGILLVEIKSVAALLPLHRFQTLAYMRRINQPLGLLFNFNVPVLKDGIRRVIASSPS